MGKKYIHYGNDHFDLETFYERGDAIRSKIVVGSSFDKPIGFWASPVDAEFGWKDWCEGEDFHTERLSTSFTFELDPSARVLEVRSFDDVADYVCEFKIDPDFPARWRWDFDKLYRDFDAVELFLSENWRLRDMEMFYCWDCDSIVIWNPKVIRSLKDLILKDSDRILRSYLPSIISKPLLCSLFINNNMIHRRRLEALIAGYTVIDKCTLKYKSNNWKRRHGIPMKRRCGRKKYI